MEAPVSRPAPAWLWSPAADLAFILSPAFLSVAAVLLFPGFFENSDAMPAWAWVLLIVGVDVTHVYSTLYRTYLDPAEFAKRKTLYTLAPAAAWGLGAVLYALGPLVFWRVMAYLAVWHFVRQQYGFMSLYARREIGSGMRILGWIGGRWPRRLDNYMIYLSTLFPLVWWHGHLPRHFHWFVEGDFIELPLVVLTWITGILYAAVALAWLVKEADFLLRYRYVNPPRFLLITGTALSWLTGIVLHNGDLAFTATNVVAHGIPYIALIWMYGRARAQAQDAETAGTETAAAGRSLRSFFPEGPGRRIEMPRWLARIFHPWLIPVWLGLIFLLAFAEEGIWDGLVWREHDSVFGSLYALPEVTDPLLLAVIVPLLSLPQVVHYILDGFIWKRES